MKDTLLPDYGLILAGVLFLIGLIGVLARRDLLFILFSVEIMINSTALAFISAGAYHGQADGQVVFIFILAAAAAEVAVALSLVLWLYHHHRTLDIDRASILKG